jgi:transcriptional regulator with XRE-family HTH domain
MDSMNANAGEALGPLIKRLREEKGWSQRKLGEEAGYGSGASISILRIEKQGVVPRPRRLDELAEKLDVDPRMLREAARRDPGNRDPDDHNDPGARIESLKEEMARRVDLEQDLNRLDGARQRANADFLLRLRTAAVRVKGARSLPPQSETDSRGSEAKYRIHFARVGVEQALNGSSDSGPGYAGLATAVAAGAHSATTMLPNLAWSAGALSGLSAVLRIGQPSARLAVGVGGAIGLTVALVGGVVSGAMAAKSKVQREKLMADLESAEKQIAESNPSVEALEKVIPSATQLFDEVALYGARALGRWEAKVGSADVIFENLSPSDQENYLALIDVAASQIAVETISLQDLATLRGPDLESALVVAEQVLAEAHAVVAAAV